MRVRAYMRGLVSAFVRVCVCLAPVLLFAKLFSIIAMFTYMFFHCVRCAVEDACMHISSRKRGVLGQFTIHMVQLYTDQPYMWLEHEHHPTSNHMYG